MVRRWLLQAFLVVIVVVAAAAWFEPAALWSLALIVPLAALGLRDALQRQHTVLRNFPIIGHMRYFMEMVRPEIQQYFIERNIDAFPVEREMRSIVYQRAKAELETQPLGTQRDVYRVGYEWASHSMGAHHELEEAPRITIGGERCSQPYDASLLNISAMSYGALSHKAVMALNKGANEGGFAHNTGEGGISPYHLTHGGDLIWQIGTGYFGCRAKDGNFDCAKYRDQAQHPNIKMIEVKLSQGAKPGHGGILPAVKVTPEIAAIRGVEVGKTVFSPPGHSAFTSPRGLLEFIAKLRDESDGKPVGFKLSVGRRTDFFCICKAMIETGITPDFISVDGGEGGTGAAPLEFTNSLGMPARDAWMFVHGALRGANLRDDIKVIATGKILTGFHIIRALAMGADVCASARGMMLALGCIQALRCNSGHCPTGITTHTPALVNGLVIEDKYERVAKYHHATIHSLLELLAAMGLSHPDDLRPHHIFRRVDDLRVRHFGELYDVLDPGQLLGDEADIPESLRASWVAATPDHWPLEAERGQYGGESLRASG